MWKIVGWLGKFIGGNVLDRVLDTVDKRVELEGDRNKIKGEIIKEHIRHKTDWMNAGGFWLMMLFAVPLGFWFASIALYNVFWHANGVYPQEWDIAALPPPLDQWSGLIIMSIFGVLGLNKFKK